jgi:hypothetical protein
MIAIVGRERVYPLKSPTIFFANTFKNTYSIVRIYLFYQKGLERHAITKLLVFAIRSNQKYCLTMRHMGLAW